MHLVEEIDDLTMVEVVEKIISFHATFEYEWGTRGGGAPPDAARLLGQSRLDWLTSLARTLSLWIENCPSNGQEDGRLILAWANLGALGEGSMKLVLSIWLHSYKSAVEAKRAHSIYKRLWNDAKQIAASPDGLVLDALREFFRKELWDKSIDGEEWNDWVKGIQARRNCIHAYRSRELGNAEEFEGHLRTYLRFLDEEIVGFMPEPPNFDR